MSVSSASGLLSGATFLERVRGEEALASPLKRWRSQERLPAKLERSFFPGSALSADANCCGWRSGRRSLQSVRKIELRLHSRGGRIVHLAVRVHSCDYGARAPFWRTSSLGTPEIQLLERTWRPPRDRGLAPLRSGATLVAQQAPRGAAGALGGGRHAPVLEASPLQAASARGSARML